MKKLSLRLHLYVCDGYALDKFNILFTYGFLKVFVVSFGECGSNM